MSEVNNKCIAEDADRYGLFMISFSRIWLVFVLILVTCSISAWFYFRYRFVFLQKRSLMLVLFLTLGLLGNTLIGSVSRSTKNTESFVHSCPFVNIIFIMIIPFVVLAGLSEVLSFMTRASLYKTIAETQESKDLLNQLSENSYFNSSSNSTIRRKAFFASKRFNLFINAFATIIIFAVAVGITSSLCPEFGSRDVCIVADTTNLSITSSVVVPTFIGAIIVVYVQRKLRTYPDPFYILREVRNGFIFGFIIAALATTLALLDPGNFADSNEIVFSYAVFVDLAFVWVFVYGVPYQIYKAFRFNHMEALYSDISLSSVLEDKVGRKLFKAHLVSEFSLENLHFIDAVETFKKTAPESQKNKAALMKTLFFQEQTLNIRYLTSKTILDKFKNDDITIDMFDDAYDEIWSLVDVDIFPRFQRSKQFEGYVGINSNN